MPNQSTIRFWEGQEGLQIDQFSDEEIAILKQYITNTEGNIFAWNTTSDLTPEQVGALLSRYSRTALTGKRLFLKEFYPNKNRGREFFEAWLVEYGDDSIQEMAGGLPMSCEFISNVAAKDIEEGRLASYIEKSTRYVFFDKKLPNGEYMFYQDPDIMGSRFADEYINLMRGLFDSYVKYVQPMAKYIQSSNPIEEQTFRIGESAIRITELTKEKEEKFGVTEEDLKKTYENATKANALDFMRDYLPMSTLTHVGISTNARSYENLILKLSSSPLAENKWIGKQMYTELYKLVPSLIKRVPEAHGLEYQKFFSERSKNTRELVKGLVANSAPAKDGAVVTLIDYTGKGAKDSNKSAEVSIAAAIIYKYSDGHSMAQARDLAENMGNEERMKLISTYVGNRSNRRHKPGRAFENVEYLFDFKGRVGIFRDIQRHRIGTQERQNFTVNLGYETRQAYNDVGIADDYRSKMSHVTDLYKKLQDKMPYQAQYVVTFGFNIHWYYRMNAREFYHVAELRTGLAGHPDYRKALQEAYREVEKVHPSITKSMSFVNMQETTLGRLTSEIRIAQKRNKLTNK